MLSARFRSIIAALAVISVTGCGDNSPPTGPDDPQDPGEGVTLASGSIPGGGGVLTVNRPGHELDGLAITVPVGSYPQATQWAVAALEVEPTLPSGMVQVGPAMKISNGQAYSKEPFLITLPARVGPDTARAAFFYDPSSGIFELIPTVALTDSTVVVMTRHVSADQLLLPGGAGALRNGRPPAFGEVVVVIVATPDQAIHDRMDSGFRPGTDDWEFPNYGSHLEPGGFCTGSTLSAIYYHYALKSSRGSLNGRFDDIDGAWEDNSRGIRLASVLQNTMDWGAGSAGMDAISDSATAQGVSWVYAQAASLSMSIKLTGRPQQVAIYKPDGSGGHAVIAFATQWGLFFIADPNEPGVERHIEYENAQFKPFPFSTNANEPGDMYDRVFVVGVTALVQVAKFKTDFQAFDDSTVGDAHFLSTRLEYLDPADTVWTLVGDTIVTASDSLIFRTICPSCPWTRGPTSTPPNRGLAMILDAAGAEVTSDTANSSKGAVHETTPGKTRIGLVELGVAPINATKAVWGYQEFRWTVVNRVPFELEASAASGGAGDEIDFTVEANDLGTSLSEYHWDFGDGSAPLVTTGDPEASHTFEGSGTFLVKVELRDTADVVRARDSVTVAIGPMAWRLDSVGIDVSGAAPGEWWEVEGVGKMTTLVARIIAVPTDGLLIPKVGGSPGLHFLGAPAGTGTTMTSIPSLAWNGPFYLAGGHEWEAANGNSWLKLGSMTDGNIEGAGDTDWMLSCVPLNASIEATTVGGVMRGVMKVVLSMQSGGKRTYTWTFRAQPFAVEEGSLRAPATSAIRGERRC